MASEKLFFWFGVSLVAAICVFSGALVWHYLSAGEYGTVFGLFVGAVLTHLVRDIVGRLRLPV